MAAASPPILPVVTPSPASGTTPAPPPPPSAPISTPAFRIFLSRLSETLRRALANRRPWIELADRSAFARPDSLSDATSRLRRNLSYFRTNYLVFLAVVLALSLLSHPFSLLVLVALLAAWSFLYLFRPADSPLVLLGRRFTDRETLAGLVILTVFVVFLTTVGSLLISALTIGAALVCVHGAFRVPEDLFLDDQEPGGAATGLLSFLGAAASSTAASAGAGMGTRV